MIKSKILKNLKTRFLGLESPEELFKHTKKYFDPLVREIKDILNSLCPGKIEENEILKNAKIDIFEPQSYKLSSFNSTIKYSLLFEDSTYQTALSQKYISAQSYKNAIISEFLSKFENLLLEETRFLIYFGSCSSV